MPETSEQSYYDEIHAPVNRLKEGLPIREFLTNRVTEFEVRADEEDGDVTKRDTTAESCFNFEDLEKVINLDMIELEDGEDGSSPFDRYRRKMSNLDEDGKLKKFMVKQGHGQFVPENSVVYIRYQAYVEYAEVPFDSTLWQGSGEGDHPVSYNLAKGQLIPGLHKGIVSMRTGEKSEFLIHPDLAYGQYGCPPRVPPEATVLFIVEVDRFIDCGDLFENQDDLDIYERKAYSNVIKSAKALYMLANDHFSKANYNAAVNKYRLLINMMHNARLANEEEENERNNFLIKNYTNACICYKKQKSYKRICLMASDAMRVDEKKALHNYKLMYHWGWAKMMLADFDGAKKHLVVAQKLMPQDRDIAIALQELDKKKKDALEKEKIMCQRAFGKIAPSSVTVREVDEAEEEFRKAVCEQLEQFKQDTNRDVLTIREQNFTNKEQSVYLEVAKNVGLYARIIGDEQYISIKKPADF